MDIDNDDVDSNDDDVYNHTNEVRSDDDDMYNHNDDNDVDWVTHGQQWRGARDTSSPKSIVCFIFIFFFCILLY